MSAEVKETFISSKQPELINLSALENKKDIKNSEYILSILEICINSHKYSLSHSNSTRIFWEEVMNNESLFAVLKVFKAETLRKYWRLIRDLNQNDKVIAVVKENSDQIDNPCYKLLPIINIICDFIKAKEKDFASYLMGIAKTKQQKPKKEEETNDVLFTFTKNKRKPDVPVELLLEVKGRQGVKGPSEKQEKHLEPSIKPEASVSASGDNNEEVSLEEIITTFQSHFTQSKKEEIYKALYMTSGKIVDAYFYLKNPEKYQNLLFVGTDDYIIQQLRNKPYYEQLLASKGEQKVKERELFLKIKELPSA